MTTTASSRPVVGAALTLPFVDMYRDWIFERSRDLELQDFHVAAALDGDWKTVADRARRILDGYRGRLGIHGPFWGFKIDSHDPDIRAAVRRRMMQGLDVCGVLGATQMVIHSPYTTWDHNNLDMIADARAKVVERVHDTLLPVVRRAESMGCELVIENIEDKDPFVRVALAQSFGSGAVKVSIDTGHAHYAHVSTGAPPVDYYVTAAGDHLRHVHLQDTDGYADRHWSPGEGTILWESVFRALSRGTSQPRLVLELRDHRDVPKAAAYLKALGLAD
ncbi:sugar phosphate isomerase/epimerase family protein [Alsobacter sp. R-9]